MSETTRAEQYEKLYPDACPDESQRAERMDRIAFKEERRSGRRTVRQRGVIVPALPWKERGR